MFILVVLAGCPASQSERCKQICKELAVCVETLERTDLAIDENECTSTCTALERDSQGKKRVDEQVACVHSAASCEAKLACP